MAKDEKQPPVSVTDYAQALIKALEENAAIHGVAKTEGSTEKMIVSAILQYQAIYDDLETLKLEE